MGSMSPIDRSSSIAQDNALPHQNISIASMNSNNNFQKKIMKSLQKKIIINNFIARQEQKLKQRLDQSQMIDLIEGRPEPSFAEKLNKFQVRDYSNNTRMNVKNHDYAAQKDKRDRMINYWQNNVINNHLPPIDERKRQEMIEIKKHSTLAAKSSAKSITLKKKFDKKQT